jgi:hypothetical protein
MTIDDAEHYSPEDRARIVAGYPDHEREARAKGIPTLGSGRVFPVAEVDIRELQSSSKIAPALLRDRLHHVLQGQGIGHGLFGVYTR